MNEYRRVLTFVLLMCSLPVRLSAQQTVSWHDPSPHTIRFVTVNDNVKLEVLDWGGSGRALVLLAGLGNTAHVFDDFAPKLTSEYHVYGITRRAFGASDSPALGYSADHLGDDVVGVLDALKINRPVLAGHSQAGEELSSIGSRHPERVAGLIYLDAAYAFAYYHQSADRVTLDLADLQKKLEQFKAEKPRAEQRQLVRQLLQDTLPGFEKDLQDLQQSFDAAPAQPKSGPAQTADDLASFTALQSWMVRVNGFPTSEAELRQQMEARPDGGVGKRLDHSTAASAILDGEQKYTEIRVPVLAIFANPRTPEPYPYNSPSERAAAVAWETVGINAAAKAFQGGVPSARVVQLANANHYVFLSNGADVLREMGAFIKGLPSSTPEKSSYRNVAFASHSPRIPRMRPELRRPYPETATRALRDSQQFCNTFAILWHYSTTSTISVTL
jgi:non-heme chloroperoxidase